MLGELGIRSPGKYDFFVLVEIQLWLDKAYTTVLENFYLIRQYQFCHRIIKKILIL